MAQRPTVTQMSRKFESHAFTILLPKYEFHQKRSQRFITSQPEPRSHVCAAAFPIWRWEL